MSTTPRDTTNRVARKYDMADVISLLDVNRYPLLAILTNAGKDPVSKQGKAFKKVSTSDPEFKWYEDDFQSKEATSHTGQTGKNLNAAVTLVVASGEGAKFAIGDIITLPSKKWNFKVTDVVTDTLTLTAELGGATDQGQDLSSLTIWIIGNANEEGATLRAIKGTTPSEKVGYCQIFRTPFGVTETSKNTDTMIKENDLDYQRRKKAIEHAVEIERAFIFGKKYKTTSGTHPERHTEGVINAISTYADASVTTEALFEAFLEKAFTNGNTEKYAFLSPAFVTMINQWAKNKVTKVETEKSYGIRITRYDSAHGTLNMIKHDILKGTPYGNYCVVLDMENLEYRYLQNRDTKLLTDRQANDADTKIEEYLTECGLKIQLESTHAICSKGAL